MTKKSKWITGISIILIIGLGIFFYIRFCFVFGEGVKSGQLNYIVHKGYIFKTYEGKLIQTGLKGVQGGIVQSNEFIFSVSNPRVAKELELMSGKELDLRYKEYLAPLPWRGMSVFVVDSIISVR
jgi:hypothetical protein